MVSLNDVRDGLLRLVFSHTLIALVSITAFSMGIWHCMTIGDAYDEGHHHNTSAFQTPFFRRFKCCEFYC